MAKKTSHRPLARQAVEVVDGAGRTHKGYYTLERGQITVHLIGGGSKNADWSATGNHDTLARVIYGS